MGGGSEVPKDYTERRGATVRRRFTCLSYHLLTEHYAIFVSGSPECYTLGQPHPTEDSP
jgi:hypothetical protein